MTVASQVTQIQNPCNGTTTQWSLNNKIFQAADLVVTLIDTLGNLYPFTASGFNTFSNTTTGLSYTVNNIDVDTGCFITFSGAPSAGWTIDLRTSIGELQSTSIKNQGSFLPELHEEFFDKATRMIQDLKRLAYTYGVHGPDIENLAWPSVGTPAARANTNLGFGPTGALALSIALASGTLSAASIGSFLYPQTAAEALQGVVPTLFYYPPGNVLRYGADATGVADSSTAVINATKANKNVSFPPGTYTVTALSFTNVANTAWVSTQVGAATLTTGTAGTMVTWGSGCNFNVVSGFVISPTGTLASSTGMLLANGAGNTQFDHNVVQLWTNAGIKGTGTVGLQQSGHKFYDNYFLQNASVAATGQLDLTYCNDYFITHNQFGIINTGTYGFPSYGVQINNSSNGQFDSNFVWENAVGANFINSKYDRCFSNRFEQSQKEGCIFNNCINGIITANWVNNNGNLATNTYIDMRFIACNHMTVSANMAFDWLGGVPQTKYAYSLESTCLNMIIKGNSASPAPSGYATAAWFFDATIPATTITTDGSLRFSSGPTVAAGSTVFLGQGANAATAPPSAQYLDASHTMVQIVVEVGAAPGAGQSFVYTLYKNGVATGLTVTLSGAGAFQNVSNATTVIEDVANSSSYTVQLVTSGAAAVTNHWAQAVYCVK